MPFLMVGATVLTVTLLSAYIPARRASRVNPTDALRHEQSRDLNSLMSNKSLLY